MCQVSVSRIIPRKAISHLKSYRYNKWAGHENMFTFFSTKFYINYRWLSAQEPINSVGAFGQIATLALTKTRCCFYFSLFYCFILICFSRTITINFYWPDKVHGMIFEWMYIFRSQLPHGIIWWSLCNEVKVFLLFQRITIFQKQEIFEAPQLHSWRR